MPTEVFEEPLDLQIYAVESILLDRSGGEAHRRAYPHTLLRPTRELRDLSTVAVVLDNGYLRVTILPAIGGRIYSIYDKRTGKEVLPRRQILEAEEIDSARGVWLPAGIQFAIGTDPRANSMAPMFAQMHRATEEGGLTGVWLANAAAPLGFHAFIGVPDDAAQVLMEIRTFNRTLGWQLGSAGLFIDRQGSDVSSQGDSTFTYSEEHDCGLAIQGRHAAQADERTLWINRFNSEADYFGPRQLDVWSVKLAPFGEIGQPMTATVEGALSIGAALRVQSTSDRSSHMLFLLTDGGQTFEAPADLQPETPLVIDLANLPAKPVAVVLRTPEREDVLSFDSTSPAQPAQPKREVAHVPDSWRRQAYLQALSDLRNGLDPRPRLQDASFEPALKAPCHAVEGLFHLSRRAYSEAIEAFEDALGHNAEDHLTWWYKAVAHRLAGEVDEERQELLNAHYLAPLEPALRAESFLQMDQSMGKEPSTILAPLTEQPEQFIDVACLLLDARLFSEAARFIDDALRHVELPVLRYLLAYAYISASRMEAEAAEQVRKAGDSSLGPPYPWRPSEIQALQKLRERFPSDKRLQEWLNLLKALHLEAGT